MFSSPKSPFIAFVWDEARFRRSRLPAPPPEQPGALTRSRGASDVDLKAVLTDIANALELLDQSGIERTR